MPELELKLLIDPRDHARLRRAAALAAATPERRTLETTYFDTPGCELAEAGLALRLRRDGARWIEGLKSGQLGAGGLHVREEWEHVRDDAGIDLARFAATPLAAVEDAATLHERLEPAFRVVMDRTTWLLAPAAGTRLEVALDVGAVETRGRREPISEVEIECLEGDPRAAFELAAGLLAELPLRPGAASKAERGYRLFRGERPAPVKARAVALERHVTPAEAARRVVASGLAQLQANMEGLLASTDPEFVHQARVALRRLRAALRMFRDFVGAERAAAWREALRECAEALGGARDWDVFATETLPPLLAAYGDGAVAREVRRRLSQRRSRERAAARASVRAPRYAATLLDIARWLWEAGDVTAAGESLPDFAQRILRKRHRRLIAQARDVASSSPEQRHSLRIAAKRLRYGTDALASVLASHRVGHYLDTLSALQDALGEGNDARTALDLMDELPVPAPLADFARPRLARRARGDPAQLRKLIGRLDATCPTR